MQKNKLNFHIYSIHLLNPYKTVVSHLKNTYSRGLLFFGGWGWGWGFALFCCFLLCFVLFLAKKISEILQEGNRGLEANELP